MPSRVARGETGLMSSDWDFLNSEFQNPGRHRLIHFHGNPQNAKKRKTFLRPLEKMGEEKIHGSANFYHIGHLDQNKC